MSLTCGDRSTVNVDQSTVNMGRVRLGRLGFGLGRSGPGRAEHVALYDAATSRSWALIRLRPQHGSRWTNAHGPWTYGRAHGEPSPPSLLLGSAHVHRAHAGVSVRGGVSPIFLPRRRSCRRRASLVSLRGEAGAQLGRGKATLGHGDHDPRALVVARVFQVIGHGGWRLGGAHRWQGRARRLSSN